MPKIELDPWAEARKESQEDALLIVDSPLPVAPGCVGTGGPLRSFRYRTTRRPSTAQDLNLHPA